MRVMIVDDDPAIRERFAKAISADARAMLVEQAATGREAIARLAHARPDVLLVDLGLPDIHGTEVIRHAARTLPKCDVMVITVFADERFRKEPRKRERKDEKPRIFNLGLHFDSVLDRGHVNPMKTKLYVVAAIAGVLLVVLGVGALQVHMEERAKAQQATICSLGL